MFLKNFFELQRLISNIVFYQSQTAPYAMETSLKAIDGTAFTSFPNTNFTNFTTSSNYQATARAIVNPFYNWSAVVGTGNATGSSSDYALDDDVTSDFIDTDTTASFTVDSDGHFVAIVTWSGTNNSGADITLKEIGVKMILGDKTDSASNTPSNSNITLRSVLIARMVLTNPVEIPDGTGGTITAKIEMF